MATVHLSRVAYGCTDLAMLSDAVGGLSTNGEVFFTTRNRPRRAAELAGNYLHFIVRHMLVARVRILRFEDADDGRTNIICSARLERVHPIPRRAHQGWRYLEDSDAPPPLEDASGVGDLPPELARELGNLALI